MLLPFYIHITFGVIDFFIILMILIRFYFILHFKSRLFSSSPRFKKTGKKEKHREN